MHRCDTDDTSMYCRMSRAVNIVKMVVFLLSLAVLGYLLYVFAMSPRGRGRRGKR